MRAVVWIFLVVKYVFSTRSFRLFSFTYYVFRVPGS